LSGIIGGRLLAEGRREFADAGGLIDVDSSIVDVWATLRGIALFDDGGETVGEDERLVVATGIAET